MGRQGLRQFQALGVLWPTVDNRLYSAINLFELRSSNSHLRGHVRQRLATMLR